MNAELLILLSVAFSIVLSAIGWAVQWRLSKESAKQEDRIRNLQKMLHRVEVDLVLLSERYRAWESLTLMADLTGKDGELSKEMKQELLTRLKGKLDVMPNTEQMRAQLNDLAKALQRLSVQVGQMMVGQHPVGTTPSG